MRLSPARRLTVSLLLAALFVGGADAVTAPGPPSGPQASRDVIVAAASDLKFALDDIVHAFTKRTGQHVSVAFGSSGVLARQIVLGAPFELFMSADEGFVLALHEQGLTRDRGELYAVGRLVIFAPRGSTLSVDADLDGLAAALDAGRVRRFAIANPEHAPYGRAAEAVLRARGLWDRIAPFLVFGDNVSQAAQFATTGDAAGGLLAYSLVLAPPMRALGTWALIPEESHPPLRQRMALTTKAGDAARSFYRFLQESTSRDLLRRYGFGLPGQ